MENTDFLDQQISFLKSELDDKLFRAGKIIGYKSYGIEQIIEKLLSINSKKSIMLASDITTINNELVVLIEDRENLDSDIDDPFQTLYNEDDI